MISNELFTRFEFLFRILVLLASKEATAQSGKEAREERVIPAEFRK